MTSACRFVLVRTAKSEKRASGVSTPTVRLESPPMRDSISPMIKSASALSSGQFTSRISPPARTGEVVSSNLSVLLQITEADTCAIRARQR
jgi:hypothetical protein